jgi:hypothetical protein
MLDLTAGATGLEPATSSVTGQGFANEIKCRFNFGADKSALQGQRFDFSWTKVEPLGLLDLNL